MENNYYQIYIASVYALASSLVIKSSDTANAINLELQINYGTTAVDLNDPTSWKYYLNLAGQYHPTDKVMQVVSVDTLQTIDFTSENLQFHRGTAAAYQYGSTPYLELVNQYPDQEQLIMGILYPVDVNVAIDAKDGTILQYPFQLVEANEYSLIPRIQEWLYSYYVRWLNPQYGLSDDLYIPTFLGVMYVMLVPAIITFRLASCKTNEAHSYHIRQYLASHGLLDVYLNYMTRSQALFLYRNIAYIERNSGKRDIFDWLVQHMLTERGLPLAEFEMRHNLADMPEQLKPLLTFKKNPLNTESNYDGVDEYSLNAVFLKEQPLAKDNLAYQDVEELRAEKLMEYSLSNSLKTKLLESTVIDYTGSEHYTLADTLLYHWLWLSHTGHYRAYVQIKSPVTDETISLTAKDAFIFYTYMQCATQGITLMTVPDVMAKRVIRVPRPSIDDVMSVANPNVISPTEAQTLLSMLPVPQPMISVDSFYEYCVALHKASLAQYYTVCQETTMNRFGQYFAVMERGWADVGVSLADNIGEGHNTWDTVSDTWDHWTDSWNGPVQSFADWFALRNIAISSYSYSDFLIMQASLLEAATGVNSSSAITLKQVQAAMISIMTKLSSYSVQYTSTINASPVIDANTGFIRLDNVKETSGYQTEVLIPVGVLEAKGHTGQSVYLDLNSVGEFETVVNMTSSMHLEITVGGEFGLLPTVQTNRLISQIDLSYELGDISNNPRGLLPVVGLDKFLQLSLDDQLTVPDTWAVDPA